MASSLALFTPCPSCPLSIAPAPVTITAQYQAVSTCTPSVVCYASSKDCRTSYPYNTFDWVSTIIPTFSNGIRGSTTVTSTQQLVTFSSTHTTSTRASGIFAAKATEVFDVQNVASFHELGPLAMLDYYSGSGLCEECESEDTGEPQQIVEVKSCANNTCQTHKETWMHDRSSPNALTTRVIDSPAHPTITPAALVHQALKREVDFERMARPACTAFHVRIYHPKSSSLKAPLGYLMFEGTDAHVESSRVRGFLGHLDNGQLRGRAGRYIGTRTLKYGVLSRYGRVPMASATWTLIGTELRYRARTFSYGGGRAVFCLTNDGFVVGQYTTMAPRCREVRLIAECPRVTTTTTKTTTTTTMPPNASDDPLVEPRGDVYRASLDAEARSYEYLEDMEV